MEAKSSGDHLNELYPKVDEVETPLPRGWSPRDKFAYLGLTHNNLRVHYKGSGKNHKDAASIRTVHNIPNTCGIYYFEVQLISKGRDGYIGVGLCTTNSNLNKLPGWEKHSYGYHADDGCIFNASGSGDNYGPTFTTGDVVGCGYNMVDKSIFFTKNGVNLGTAFTGVATNIRLYPTVGLQTPGELVEANFGTKPFVFDFDGMLKELYEPLKAAEEHRAYTTCRCHDYLKSFGKYLPYKEQQWQSQEAVEQFVVSGNQGVWQASLHKMVLDYLVHYGYCNTAQLFASATGQLVEEEMASIRNRQQIQQLILSGQISEALRLVYSSYPGLLESQKELLFRLKCQQFVEMLIGNDSKELYEHTSSPTTSLHSPAPSMHSPVPLLHSPTPPLQSPSLRTLHNPATVNGTASNGLVHSNGVESEDSEIEEDKMEVEQQHSSPLCSPHSDCEAASNLPLGGNKVAIQRLLAFGREVQKLFNELYEEGVAHREELRAMLQDTFSLLGYAHPQSSPVSHLLDSRGREVVCTALNSAILASKSLQEQSSLEYSLGHCDKLIQVAGEQRIGAAVFTGVNNVLTQDNNKQT